MAKAKDIDWAGELKESDLEISKAAIAEIKRLGEDLLKRHIETSIYAIDRRGENSWVHRKKYERRHQLPETVRSYVEGNYVWITADGEPNTPIGKNSTFVSAEPGAFLGLLESGNLGFLTKTRRYAPKFPRPVLKNAQKEADSAAFRDQVEKILNKSL